jgi:hypothetical protein
MPDFQKAYGDTEGPLGIPMPDKVARAVDALLKQLPKTDDYKYRHAVLARAPSELNPGERSDVSWISTESPDRHREVVLSRGMNDSQFAQNPLVTMGHNYWCAPVGKSLWRKKVKDGAVLGIKAKTRYPEKPSDWPKNEHGEDTPWPPDKVFCLIQAGLLQGKSIGFLPLKTHTPDDKEYARNGWKHDEVRCVIDEWLLLEYACVFLPANQDSLVEAVAKGETFPPELLKAMGIDPASLHVKTPRPPPPTDRPIAFTPLSEIEKAVQSAIAAVDFTALARKSVELAYAKAKGIV